MVKLFFLKFDGNSIYFWTCLLEVFQRTNISISNFLQFSIQRIPFQKN